jgi:hypothetical protein
MSIALLPRATTFVGSVLFVAVSACSQAHPHPNVPLPAGTLAVAPLHGGRVAALAGDDTAKGIFIIEMANGAVAKSFGATKEATGIVADGGSLLLSVGRVAHGKAFGSIERWSLEGAKQRVVPLPSAALAITRELDGLRYVLLEGKGEARSAVPIHDATLRVGRPIPLDAGAQSLQLCAAGDATYLLYTDGDGEVTIRGLRDAPMVHSRVTADAPECASHGRVYAISKSFTARVITVFGLPGLQQIGSIPVSNDAAALYSDSDHVIMALDTTSQSSGLEMVP